MTSVVRNRNGVIGQMIETCPSIQIDTGRRTHEVFVPRCCLECDHFDSGEQGDYGEAVGWPTCRLNLFLPTRKGTCRRQINTTGWRAYRPQEAPIDHA